MKTMTRNMNSTMIRPALALTLMIFGAAALTLLERPAMAAASASTIQVTDLGVLPGGTYSTARAINNLGQVVGISTDAAQAYQTVIWSGGSITTIGYCCPGGLQRFEALNDLREAVGWNNGGYATSGYYWDPSGQAWILPALPGGENRVHAYDINNSGIIVGASRDGSFDRHAVVWDRTLSIRELGFLGVARGINDLGDIVGQAAIGNGHAFLLRNGNFTDLGDGFALDINTNGLILGWTSGQIPVVWRNGVVENLPALSGDPIGYGHIVTGLNNNGDVVGYAPSPVGIGFRYTAVLWRGGKAINLGFFPGGTSSMAYDINDAGQIVGEGSVVADGPMHALLWTVGGVNQPPTAVMTATPLSGAAPLTVTFDGSGSTDPDGTITTWAWSFGDGAFGTGSQTTHIYSTPGTYNANLTVTDNSGESRLTSASIVVTTPGTGTSTGFLSPSANAAQTSSAGDNNGYQTSPANAYANDSSVATDTNSGTNNNTSCTNNGKDKHRYDNYNFNIPATAMIKGIEVRLDARADATSGSPKMCVQISWDGGTTWTTAKSTATLGTTETTYTLGATSDTWGRTWTPGNFSNANFRIRVIDVAGNTSRDFYLDYVAVNVTYQP